MKGIIALDIDGTLTVEMQPPPQAVITYLHQLVDAGWCLVFITGRTYHWGYEALKILDFPFFYSVQNGAITLKLPEEEVVIKNYLSRDILSKVENICENEPSDVVVYSGYEHGDRVYYRPKHFDPKLLAYLEKRQAAFHEEWTPIDSFDEVNLDSFPALKCFGDSESAQRISEKLCGELNLEAPPIRDPFNEESYVVQATRSGINKGSVLTELKKHVPFEGVVIAAGDDFNDIPMLKAADISVAMANGPQELLEVADITAPPAEEQGIVVGLNRAMKLVGSQSGS